MSKQELITKLTELKYETELIDNIPYIYNVNYAEADELIKNLGYTSSYGVKLRKEQV